ncbi:hypothetical protein [Herbiconiux sp. YIM B11900]|uniref:hypothetical protein n=1 Tax=Herbiconiux sp. YIM B11900 TaxID=3404131 RepID=UPI003F876BF6
MNIVDLSELRHRRRLWEQAFRSPLTVWCLRAVVALGAIMLATTLPPSASRAYLALAVGIAGILALEVARQLAQRRRGRRLRRFAASNGLSYTSQALWSTPSALIERAANCRVSDEFRSTAAGSVTRIGTLTFETERASTLVTENWGYISLSVPGDELPHVVLVSRDPRGRSLPAALDRNQILTLEGDFWRSFDVYCGKEDRLDALYLLTPDLMARLADDAGYSSVEFGDNYVTILTPGRFDPDDPEHWEKCLRLSSSIGTHSLMRARRLNRVDASGDVRRLADAPAKERSSRLSLSIGRSNRSTEIVGLACTLAVAAIFLWTWLH